VQPSSEYAVGPWVAILLTDLGVSPGNVLRRAGLPGDLLMRGPVRLPAQRYFDLWRGLEDESPDPGVLPIRIAEALAMEAFDPAIFAAACSRDLDRAAARIARFKPLIGPMRLEVARTDEATTVSVRWPPDERPPEMLALTELVFWVALARLATRRVVRPLSVTAPHLPRDPAPYREYLGTEIVRARSCAVAFSSADARRPFVTANERMWEFFEPELRRRLSELRDGAPFSERVRAALVELLPAGDAGTTAVARELAVSTRTLQRRLREEGTTFQAELARTREALARHYLTSSSVTSGEISFLLGYEDPNSFYRAFRGWTGDTPARVRAGA
jgi:AraC-like DNA-binding protein